MELADWPVPRKRKHHLVLLSPSALFLHLLHLTFQHGVCRTRGIPCYITNTNVPSNPRINSSTATSQPYESNHTRTLHPSFHVKYSADLKELRHKQFTFKITPAISLNHKSSLRNQETAKAPPHTRRQCRIEEEPMGRRACVASTHVRCDRYKTTATIDGCLRTCQETKYNTKLSITIRYDQRFDPKTFGRGRFLDARIQSRSTSQYKRFSAH